MTTDSDDLPDAFDPLPRATRAGPPDHIELTPDDRAVGGAEGGMLAAVSGHRLDTGVGSQALVDAARARVGRVALSGKGDAGTVAAALRTRDGHVHTGICLDLPCGLGACAEYAAVAEMLKTGETDIEEIVAVNRHRILPPCGRCRELLVQLSVANLGTHVVLDTSTSTTLERLLPARWT